MELLEIFYAQFQTESLIMWGGVALIVAAIFVETGLLLGLIIPGGETLLFTAGLLTATESISIKVWMLILVCFAAAIAGDNLGYYIGKKTGPNIYKWKENFFYKKKYLKKGDEFYRNHGSWALVLGRFLPVIRTFNPLLAGVAKLNWSSFIIYVVIGSALYITSIILAGYFLGQQFPNLKNYLEYIFLAVALLVLIPLIRQLIKDNKKK